ncbi:hypothetical protein CVO_03180 [Sulfurimonas sp. CVO]|jgi:hypothetical protein|uniref:CBU-0592-like domain-containing protein n=1 Tax=Sulfurimonas xiamenensis TaxID=2590021 RepID=A0AAJ4A440_9BACT|nr:MULTISPECIES: hypothetical protein [Sulfurimonas]PLY15461.1 MAG: hypothetical protein C0628_02840 [Sulfurimonas sp.]QFR43529.1 hypothetical protein FJR47_06255 [Sulfurimonas xiamenensis]QHG90901.1 hypothetical protein CVO_03180 [Sulfurimonas sp. CVO]
MSSFAVDVVGIVGVAMVLATYFLLQSEKIDAKGFFYSFFNFLGALLIVYSLLYNWNFASFIIEFFWILISVYGLYKWYKNKKQNAFNDKI